MDEAGKEESALPRKLGDVDKDGYPLIYVIADWAWSKTSYKTDYSALSGVACIVGIITGKLLYIGVRIKFCIIFAKAQSNAIPEHRCTNNWKITSNSMESDIIREGFKVLHAWTKVRKTCR